MSKLEGRFEGGSQVVRPISDNERQMIFLPENRVILPRQASSLSYAPREDLFPTLASHLDQEVWKNWVDRELFEFCFPHVRVGGGFIREVF